MFPILILLLAFLFIPVGLYFSLSVVAIALVVGFIMLVLGIITGVFRAVFKRPSQGPGPRGPQP